MTNTPAAIEYNGRTAFASWDGVTSLGRVYYMSEEAKQHFRDLWAEAELPGNAGPKP